MSERSIMSPSEDLFSKAVICPDMPAPAIPDSPAFFSDGYDLWLAYETFTAGVGGSGEYVVVLFSGVIDQRFSPINDEGIGEHPYRMAGIQVYEFQEVLNSDETKKWKALCARHWVITFKDNTLDVIAKRVEVVAMNRIGRDSKEVLMKFFELKNCPSESPS